MQVQRTDTQNHRNGFLQRTWNHMHGFPPNLLRRSNKGRNLVFRSEASQSPDTTGSILGILQHYTPEMVLINERKSINPTILSIETRNKLQIWPTKENEMRQWKSQFEIAGEWGWITISMNSALKSLKSHK